MTNLFVSEPFSHYKIWVNAYTWKNEGEPSKTLEFHTDVQGNVLNLLLTQHIPSFLLESNWLY